VYTCTAVVIYTAVLVLRLHSIIVYILAITNPTLDLTAVDLEHVTLLGHDLTPYLGTDEYPDTCTKFSTRERPCVPRYHGTKFIANNCTSE
jgi:hypothetical protein